MGHKSSIQCQKEGTWDEGTEALRAWSQMSHMAQSSRPDGCSRHRPHFPWSESPGLLPEEALGAGLPHAGMCPCPLRWALSFDYRCVGAATGVKNRILQVMCKCPSWDLLGHLEAPRTLAHVHLSANPRPTAGYPDWKVPPPPVCTCFPLCKMGRMISALCSLQKALVPGPGSLGLLCYRV